MSPTAPAVSHRHSHCPQDPTDHCLAGARTPTPPCQMRKLRQDKHHQPRGIWHRGPGCAGLGDVRGARARPRGRAGGRHPDLPLRLIWLVFTLSSCPRCFCFLKPRTCSTFIIKTHKTGHLRTAAQPAWEAAGLGPARPHAAPGSLRSVPAALCAPFPPLKTGRAFPSTSRCHGEKGPSHKAKCGLSGFMVLPCAPCWGPGQEEKRQWLHTATPKLRPHRGSPAPREPECCGQTLFCLALDVTKSVTVTSVCQLPHA